MYPHNSSCHDSNEKTTQAPFNSLPLASDANNGHFVATDLDSLTEGIVDVADDVQISVPDTLVAIKTAISSFGHISTLPIVSNEISDVNSSERIVTIFSNENSAILLDSKRHGPNGYESSERSDASEDNVSTTANPRIGAESDFATPMSRTLSDNGCMNTLYSAESHDQGKSFKAQANYWCHTLVGTPKLLDLPTDRPRSAEQSFERAQQATRLGVPLTQSLKKLSQENDVDLCTTLIVGWSVVLSRLSGQDDIVIGIVNDRANINNKEKNSAPNVLPLRIDLSEDPSTAQMLDRVAKTIQAARTHQGLPFESIVDIVQPVPDRGHAPLLQATFQWRNGGLSQASLDETTAKFDLETHFQEEGDEIVGDLNYSTALFDISTIERHLGYFQSMLQAMATDVTQPFDTIDMISPSEQELVLQTWNTTEVLYPDQ
ncbi:hypothetical protein EDD11_009613, partial [Mortierella claussenii]